MRTIGIAFMAALGLVGCSPGPTKPPLPEVSWLVPYTSDANIPRHRETDLELRRVTDLLGLGQDKRSLLKRTQFETSEQFQARGPSRLAELSPLVGERSRFVFSVPAKILKYDLATKTATLCVFDLLLNDCIEKKADDKDAELSVFSVGLAGRAYSQFEVLRFTNADLKVAPVPVQLPLEPSIADNLDAAGNAKIAFVVSFGPPFPADGPASERSVASRGETLTTKVIEAHVHRIVVYQANGPVAGALEVGS